MTAAQTRPQIRVFQMVLLGFAIWGAHLIALAPLTTTRHHLVHGGVGLLLFKLVFASMIALAMIGVALRGILIGPTGFASALTGSALTLLFVAAFATLGMTLLVCLFKASLAGSAALKLGLSLSVAGTAMLWLVGLSALLAALGAPRAPLAQFGRAVTAIIHGSLASWMRLLGLHGLLVIVLTIDALLFFRHSHIAILGSLASSLAIAAVLLALSRVQSLEAPAARW